MRYLALLLMLLSVGMFTLAGCGEETKKKTTTTPTTEKKQEPEKKEPAADPGTPTDPVPATPEKTE